MHQLFRPIARCEQKGDEMALFLSYHEFDGREPEAWVAAWADAAGSRIRCLKHWVSDNAIALLVEAPNEGGLRASDSRASEVVRLYAPARRWLAYETIHFPR